MSSYSSTYPSIRPVFNADFSNAGRLDSRISYSRSTTGSFYGKDKHLSSENLILYSDLSSGFTFGRTNLDSTNNSAPDGGSDAASILETVDSSSHEVYETFSCVSGKQYSFVFYLKANGRTKVTFKPQAPSTIANVTFDLTAVTSTVISGSVDSHSITAIGSTGWHKCVVVVTSVGTGTGYTQINFRDSSGNESYTGDVTKGMYAWGASVSSTGTVLNETSGQIHREYAPTLQTAAINAPRFEHSASDSASMGLLIEGQATNINTYSKGGVNGSGVVQWQVDNGSATGNSAVGPDGTLSALHFVPNTTTTAHYAYNNVGSTPSGSTPHTISVYAKAAGYSDIVIRLTSSYSAFANTINATFTLTGDGSVSVTGGTATAAIESCGNGWYRCQVTETTGSSPTGMRPYIYARQAASYAGDGFSGVLLWGWQVEANSFASSFVDTGTSGGTATRAADSASMDLTQAGFNGGPVSMQVGFRANVVLGKTHRIAGIENTRGVLRPYISAGGDVKMFGDVGGTTVIDTSIKTDITANTDYSVALRWDTNDYRGALDGTLGNADTTCPLPDFEGATLYVGTQSSSGFELDGHVKRLAIYPALTDTNLQALTK